MNLCFYEAVDRLPLGMAVTIELLGPLGLAVAMSRRWRELAWCGLAIVGVALLGEAGHDVDPAGVAFALAAAGCWAGYILLSRETGRRFRRFDGLALAMGVGVLVTGPIAVGVAGTALLSPTVLAAGAVVAVLSALIPFSLEIVALRRTSPRTFGVLMSLSPAAATLSGFVLLHQQLGVVQLTAIACVIIASAGTVMGTSGRTPRRLRHLSRGEHRFAAIVPLLKADAFASAEIDGGPNLHGRKNSPCVPRIITRETSEYATRPLPMQVPGKLIRGVDQRRRRRRFIRKPGVQEKKKFQSE
jgi:threonine/homoserine efflux transporter RhtA